LSMGNLLHKVKELCSQALINGQKPDYKALEDITLHTGWEGTDKASAGAENAKNEVILSVDKLKIKFFDDWIAPDVKSGLTYDQKLKIFFEHLSDEEQDQEWTTIGVEVPFEFEVRPGILIRGLIDKVQKNREGQLRIVDYKSSKAVYDSKKLTTPLQLYIYHLACQKLYPDTEIIEYMYDFILLGEQRLGGTKGWLSRAEKKLNKLLDSIEECASSDTWKPSPTPLCYWCPYCAQNPNAKLEFRHHCPYYSLWTPTNKTFSTNKEWDPDTKDANMIEQEAIASFRW